VVASLGVPSPASAFPTRESASPSSGFTMVPRALPLSLTPAGGGGPASARLAVPVRSARVEATPAAMVAMR
jgi:hypothetical protein